MRRLLTIHPENLLQLGAVFPPLVALRDIHNGWQRLEVHVGVEGELGEAGEMEVVCVGVEGGGGGGVSGGGSRPAVTIYETASARLLSLGL
jgi:hypothetical protein